MEIALWTVSLQGLESNPQYFTHWCQVVSCRSGRCKTKVQRGEITAISWHVAASGHAPMGSILTFSWYEGIYVMLLDGFGEVAKYKSRFLNQFCKILSLWANLYTKKLVEPLSVFFFVMFFSFLLNPRVAMGTFTMSCLFHRETSIPQNCKFDRFEEACSPVPHKILGS